MINRISKGLCLSLALLMMAGCAGNRPGAINEDLTPNYATSKPEVQRYMRMAEAAQDQGDPNTAMMMYSAANKADPSDPAPLLASAQFLELSGEFNGAARLYDSLATQQSDDHDRLTLQLAAARTYLKGKNYAEAVTRYERLANQIGPNGGDWRAYNGLGVVRDLEGNSSTAIRAYQTAMERAPEDDKPKVRANLALSYLLQGSAQKTIELLEPVEKREPLSTNEQRSLALAYGFMGRTEDAHRLGLDEVPTYQQLKQSLEVAEAPNVKAAPPGKVTRVPVE